MARQGSLRLDCPAGIAVTAETDTRQSLRRGFRRDHARNSAALSVAHSRNVFAGAPVISSTVDVTCAGWPMAAAQAVSSIFTATNGPTVSGSGRASSGDISSMRNEQSLRHKCLRGTSVIPEY
jgi:hypothetical protein